MANFNFNKVILGGRLCADPELKVTPSGVSVTTFTVAVNRRKKDGEKDEADFFNVTAWRNTAEFITRYFRKASCICVEGELHNRSWTDNSGVTRYAVEVIASAAYFVDSKADGAIYAPAPASAAPAAPAAAMPQPGVYGTVSTAELREMAADEELPF